MSVLPGTGPGSGDAPDGDGTVAAVTWRHRVVQPGKAKIVTLIAVFAVLAGVGVVSAAVPPPTPAPAPATSDAVPIAPADAHASSGFCTAGTGTSLASTIYLRNSTDRAVTTELTTVAASAPPASSTRTVSVPPLGNEAVDPSAGLPAGSTATAVAVAGGGVAVDQVVSGPGGWSTAPCASQLSGQWYFAGGSTSNGDTLSLSLFDPAAAQAVVNVSFLTASGVITPQAYQGLAVAPGQVLVENVGDFVQNASDIATVITAESGGLVADELQQWSTSTTGGVSLRLGAPEPMTTWRFAQTTVTPGSTVAFTVANPGAGAVTARFTPALASGSAAPVSLTVPADATVVLDVSSTAGWPARVAYAVSIDASGPVVVGRSVEAGQGATTPVRGANMGTPTATDSWLVSGPGVPGAPGAPGASAQSLAIADPGPVGATVVVRLLGHAGSIATVKVAPRSLTVLGVGLVGTAASGLGTYVVTADQPVIVEMDDGPTGAPGVVASTGFPFGP